MTPENQGAPLSEDAQEIVRKYMALKSHGYGEMHVIVEKHEGQFANVTYKHKLTKKPR